MKTFRNLSGIYFRYQKEDGTWGNRCFEELPIEDQRKYMQNRSDEWLQSLCINLADTLYEIGEKFDITR